MKNKLIEIFKELNYNNISLFDMLQTDHGDSPYHKEGSILTHLEMVYNKAVELYPDDQDLHIACFLHDVGKPFCKFYDTEANKTRFNGHESFSVFVALDVLNKLNIDMNKERILKLIQRHADPYKYSLKNLKKLYDKETYKDVIKIHTCDTLGRIPAKEPVIYDINGFKDSFDIPVRATKISLMVGPQCSGKSTYLRYYGNNVISRDEIIELMFPKLNYNEAFKQADQDLVNKCFEVMVQKYYKDFNYIVIDKMHLTVKSRRYNLKAMYDTNTIVVGLKTLLERNNKRAGKQINKDVIFDSLKRFQFVYPGELITDNIIF